ncbi:MAG: pyruvate,orthophosphate dikinase, partial [Afipia broomeae]
MQRLEAMAKASSKKSAAKSSPKSVSKSKPAAKAKPAAAKPAGKAAAKAAAKTSAPAVKKITKPAAKQTVQAGKWVYTFGDGRAEGKAGMRDLLGGKGANLAEMANLGLPVPPGFTIPTSVCTYFYANDKTYPKDLKAQVEKALVTVGKIAGKTFGDAKNPLLVSVR